MQSAVLLARPRRQSLQHKY